MGPPKIKLQALKNMALSGFSPQWLCWLRRWGPSSGSRMGEEGLGRQVVSPAPLNEDSCSASCGSGQEGIEA